MTNHEYPHPLLTMWRVLVSIPLTLVIVMAMVLLYVGWGLREPCAADRFLNALLREFYD